MLFGLSSVLALVLGTLSLSDERKSVLGFLWLLAILPTGNSYADFISANGIYFFDFYLLGVLISFGLSGLAGESKPFSMGKWVAAFVALYACYYFTFYFVNGVSKYFIKDLRPFIFVMLFLAFSSVCSSSRFWIKANDVLLLVIVGSLFNVLDLLWINVGVVEYKDEFYETNSYRYLDMATYFSVAYVIAYFSCKSLFFSHRKLALWAVLAAFVCIFLSNSRFILLSTFLALLATQWGTPRRFFPLLILGIIGIGSFLMVSHWIGAERIIAGLEEEGLALQIASRFGPGLELIDTMDFYQFIFGLGPGTYFDIPWFAYRGLETENVNIDSAYMTFFVKYGLFSVVILMGYLASFLRGAQRKVKAGTFVFFGLMFVVSASPYQPYAIGFGLASVLIAMLGRKGSVVHG